MASVFESLVWGFIASVPLLLGSLVALFVGLPKSIIATIMAFGSGVLIAALAPSLIEEAFSLSQSIPAVILGFALGGLSYTAANYILTKRIERTFKEGEKVHMEIKQVGEEPSGLSLLVGSVMDNIPENMALGISLVTGDAVNIVLIAAILFQIFQKV